MVRGIGALTLGLLLAGCGNGPPAATSAGTVKEGNIYPVHRNITATVFWVGEPPTRDNAHIANDVSAWDERWQAHYGGFDDPEKRRGYFPADFTPRENPFYCALPYTDFTPAGRRGDVGQVIPWAGEKQWGKRESMCKNRWVKITRGGRTAYAQWEDVGPFVTDDAAYVFGGARPRNTRNHHAGIDLSPAVRDALRLDGMEAVDWQFVEEEEVPAEPWKQIVTRSGIDWK